MKKIFTLAAFVLCTIAYSYGQQNVYGGDFEHWKLNPAGYYDPDSSMFHTLDTLVTVQSGTTAFRCDTMYAGNYSVRLVTSKIDFLSVIIPGVIGTLKINWTVQKAILGVPYPYGSGLPVRFQGYYKTYPILGDSSAAVILLSKWNTATHGRDTLAYNRLVFKGTVTDWTRFDTLITYRDHSTIPDTLTLLMLSCGGFNAANMFGSVGQVGNTAMFDDVNLTEVSGLPLQFIPSMDVKLSPNPVSQILNVELEKYVDNGYFEIFDAQAKLIRKFPISGTSGHFSVSDLSGGVYHYKLTEGTTFLNSGTFIVTK